jgi:hypothetical protein
MLIWAIITIVVSLIIFANILTGIIVFRRTKQKYVGTPMEIMDIPEGIPFDDVKFLLFPSGCLVNFHPAGKKAFSRIIYNGKELIRYEERYMKKNGKIFRYDELTESWIAVEQISEPSPQLLQAGPCGGGG